MTASYTSPLVITVRRFTAGRLLYSKDPRGRGKDTIPRQNFPAKRRKAFSVAQFARRVCSRFIGRVNLSDRGAPGVANGEPTPRHPPLYSKLHPWRRSIPQVIPRIVV